MNNRQKKKTGLILSKKVKDLVRNYTELHQNQDKFGGTFSYIGLDEFEYGFMPKIICTLTEKTSTKIYNDCVALYKYVNTLLGTWYGEYSCDSVENCRNYRIISRIEDERDFELVTWVSSKVPYYVYQIGYYDDYNGTIYLPLRNGKFLAYDYTC